VGGPTPESARTAAAQPVAKPPVPGRAATPAAANGAVDFDALHAALGANDEASGKRLPATSDPDAVEVELDSAPDNLAESLGRSNASYASSKPHVVKAATRPNEDLAAPAVIVAHDTVPGGPPNMTMPLGTPQTPPAGQPISGPHVAAAPSSGQHAVGPAGAGYPATPPEGFSPVRAPRQTVRMDVRPRRPKAMTVVVRPRGPSTGQKIGAFVGMLLLVIACGVAVIVWRKPMWLGFAPVPTEPAPTAVTVVPPAVAATNGATSAAAPATNAAPPASASAAPGTKKPLKH
jgi:hypothetical protein